MSNRISRDKLAVIANQKTVERKFWLEKLSGIPEKCHFPFDTIKENKTENRMKIVQSRLTGELFSKLCKLSAGSDVKLNMILVAALEVLLAKYTGGNDIAIGAPIYKQQVDSDFINTILVFREQLHDSMTFKQLLLQVRETINTTVENQNYPIELLAETLNIQTLGNESTFFDIVIMLDNIHNRKYIESVHYYMLFAFKRTDRSLEVESEYNASLYRQWKVEQILRHYIQLLEIIFNAIEAPLTSIDILSAAEKEQLLIEFNGREEKYPCDKTFHVLFEEQVERTPDRIAIFCHGQSRTNSEKNDTRNVGAGSQTCPITLTYRELNMQSDQLARLLIEKGVLANNIVGIMVDRSVEMIVGTIGILKSGGAYLPIDPTYPQERINYILKDSGTKLLAVANDQEGEKVRRWEGEIVLLKEISRSSYPHIFLPSYLLNPSNLAYVIYTSGSTGKPKGVMVQHNHFVNVAMGWRQEYKLLEMKVVLLQMANFCFDVFAGDLARVFLNSGKMVINPVLGADPEALYQLIDFHQVTLFESTPSYIIPFMNYVYKNNLKIASMQLLILGSDTCSSQDFNVLVARYGKQMRIINSYGVTEATIDSSYYEALAGTELPSAGNVPIGRPFPNVNFYILDSVGKLAPIGVPGELCIGGASVARGYLNKPELTAKSFSVSQGPRGAACLYGFYKQAPLVYHTGDLARWLPGGNVEFLGRKDYQIKIRGFRIELGEIENCLLEHDDIQHAIVVEKTESSGDAYLCGYIISNKTIEPEELRDFLGKRLPTYMVPWFYVQMDRFPLTTNGKIDRNALPEPETIQQIAYVAPRDEMETELVRMWVEVLAVDNETIGIDSRFFDLGGNSMKAIILASRIKKQFNTDISLEDIFNIQTTRGIAQYIKGAGKSQYVSIDETEKKEYYVLSPAQKRLYAIQQVDLGSTAYNMPLTVVLEGKTGKEKFSEVFNKLIARHESFRTSFHLIHGEPVQVIHNSLDFQIEYSESVIREQGARIIAKFVRPFDLAQAPLLRVGLIKSGEGKYMLLADMHHIVSDGVSHNLLIIDFLSLYRGDLLEPLKLQYKDYAEWQNRQIERDKVSPQENYWLKQFSGSLPILDLPTDYPRPVHRGFEGSVLGFRIGKDETMELTRCALANGATLQMVMLTILNILLAKLTHQEDIIIGIPVAGRRHSDLEKIIGIFVNVLAVRSFPTGGKTFSEFLTEVRENSLKAYDNQDYPLDLLVKKVVGGRDAGRNPLFDVIMEIVENETGANNVNLEIPDLKVVPYEMQTGTSKIELDWFGIKTDHGLYFEIHYNTELFKKETIKKLSERYLEIVEQVLENEDIRLADIKISHRFRKAQSSVSRGAGEHFTFDF